MQKMNTRHHLPEKGKIKISKNSIVYAGVIISAIGFLCTRPTAIGEVYSFYGATIILAGTLIAALSLSGKIAPTRATILPILLALLAFYMFAIDVLKDSHTAEDAPKAALLSAAAALSLLLVSLRADLARKFYDTIAIIIFFSCASIVVTFTLLATGASAQSLKIFHFSYTYLPPSGDILFPLSLRNNTALTPFGRLPRLAGIFREVGLLPAFACWAAYYLAARRLSVAFAAICLAGAVACLSSLGALLAAITAMAILAERTRIPKFLFTIIAPIGAIIIFFLLYNIPYFGIAYKIHEINESFRDRQSSIEAIFTTKDLVFGDGASLDKTGAINLPSQIYHYGILGFGLVMAIYATALRNIKMFLGGLMPTVFTMMTAQPAGTDPLVISLFMSWFAFIEPAKSEKRTSTPSVKPASPTLVKR